MIILILFFIILFYFVNILIFPALARRNTKEKLLIESFDTYFQPFFTSKFDKIYTFYNDNTDNTNYFKKQFYYNKLNFGYAYNNILNKHLSSLIISKSNFTNINLIKYKTDDDIVTDLSNYKIDLSILSSPYLSTFQNNTKLRTITKVINKSIYFITLYKYNIISTINIPLNTTIGILNNDSALPIIINDIFTSNNYISSNYNIKTFNSYDELFISLQNNNIQLILCSIIYPDDNNPLNSFIIKYTLSIHNTSTI